MASLQIPLFAQWRLAMPRLAMLRTIPAFQPITATLHPSHPPFHLPFSPLAMLSVLPIGASSLLEGLWESILRAVPKKKTTHSKSRHRQMAGKALKDVTELVKCPACGNVKRAHVLCIYCVKDIKDMWKGKNGNSSEAEAAVEKT